MLSSTLCYGCSHAIMTMADNGRGSFDLGSIEATLGGEKGISAPFLPV